MSEDARLAPYLEASETLLWSWDQRSRHSGFGFRSPPRWSVLLLFSVVASIANVVLQRVYPDVNGLLISLLTASAFLALPLYIIDWLAAKGRKGSPSAIGAGALRAGQKVRDAAWSVEGIGRRGDPGLHALTDRRVLTVFRDGSHVATPLTPGEPIIQYGNLRIERPNHRGIPLIRRIPLPEQHRLFAALKEARRIREAAAQNGAAGPLPPTQTAALGATAS